MRETVFAGGAIDGRGGTALGRGGSAWGRRLGEATVAGAGSISSDSVASLGGGIDAASTPPVSRRSSSSRRCASKASLSVWSTSSVVGTAPDEPAIAASTPMADLTWPPIKLPPTDTFSSASMVPWMQLR
jgi:hypothetical protein